MWTSQIWTVIFCPQFQLMIIYIFCMHFVKLELAFCQTNINAHPYHSFNCEALTLLLILSQIPQFALDIHFGHNFFEMPPSSILQQISDHHISLPVLFGDAVLLKLCFHVSESSCRVTAHLQMRENVDQVQDWYKTSPNMDFHLYQNACLSSHELNVWQTFCSEHVITIFNSKHPAHLPHTDFLFQQNTGSGSTSFL